jgi:hypothetical protein
LGGLRVNKNQERNERKAKIISEMMASLQDTHGKLNSIENIIKVFLQGM